MDSYYLPVLEGSDAYDDSLYVKSLNKRGLPLVEGLNKPGPDSVEILSTVLNRGLDQTPSDVCQVN
jgi:hypothetical protein